MPQPQVTGGGGTLGGWVPWGVGEGSLQIGGGLSGVLERDRCGVGLLWLLLLMLVLVLMLVLIGGVRSLNSRLSTWGGA